MEENVFKIINKVLTVILMIFITYLILKDFNNNCHTITYEIILCLGLIIILILSESFDILSIPKVISLQKNVKEKEKENDKLKDYSKKLMEQLISVNSINNNSSNNNVTLNVDSLSKSSSPDIEDLKNDESDEQIIEENKQNREHKKDLDVFGKFQYRRNLELYLLKKLTNDEKEFQYEVKVTNMGSEDGIMKNQVRFDALKLEGAKATFYEVKVFFTTIDRYSYRLAQMIRMVETYGKVNSCESKLVLVIPKFDSELDKILDSHNYLRKIYNTFFDTFSPSINRGLLEIKEIEVSKKELDKFIENYTTNDGR